ncbi:MAG: type II toxin-antitoxin system PemK/MazF family toxin [Ardenticatenaceae bacterium]
MRRGEVWWANLPQPSGRRPVLLLSRDAAYARRASITVAPVTRTSRGIPVEVSLSPADGMPVPCVVNTDDIVTIPKALIQERITFLSRDKMQEVARAIVFALDLGPDLDG